jgi:hypothetical protein
MSNSYIELNPIPCKDFSLPVYIVFLGWTEKTVNKLWIDADVAAEALFALLHQYNKNCTAPDKTEQINIMWNTVYGWIYMLAVNYSGLDNDWLDVFEEQIKIEEFCSNKVETILAKNRADMQIQFNSLWEYRN